VRIKRRFASALVDRERCILELERTIFDQEVREVHVEAEQAHSRFERAGNESSDVEADLARVQAEGPANHRKRDHIDKVRPPRMRFSTLSISCAFGFKSALGDVAAKDFMCTSKVVVPLPPNALFGQCVHWQMWLQRVTSYTISPPPLPPTSNPFWMWSLRAITTTMTSKRGNNEIPSLPTFAQSGKGKGFPTVARA